MTTPIPIRLSLRAPGPHIPRRTREPITIGVPLPKGYATGRESWQLRVADARVPVQSKALDRWPDQSVRWLLVDAQVDVDGEAEALLERVDQGITPADRVSVQDARERAGAVRLFMAGVDGRSCEFAVAGIEDQESGPLRSRVALAGRLTGDGPLSALNVSATIDTYAGSPVCRIAVTIQNPQPAVHKDNFWDLGDPGSILIKQATLQVSTSGSGQVIARCSVEPGAPASPIALPLEIYQDSSGGENWDSPIHINRNREVPLQFRGYRVRSGSSETTGLRASPVIELRGAETSIAASIDHFWQNFPKAIEASTGGTVSLHLYPPQSSDLHELQGGEQKTHVCYVAFGHDQVTAEPLAWTRSRLAIAIDPAWIAESGAIPWFAPDESRHRALVANVVEGSDTFIHKREVVDEYGWRNFGDVYGDHEGIRHKGPKPLVSQYNNQYDPVAGFLYQFFRTGDARWQSMAAELAAHVVDIDVYHTDRDKASYNHGMFWHTYHYGHADTSTHRTHPRAGKGETHGGGPSPDHNYTTGLMLQYFLTGDEALRRTVIDLAQFVINADDGNQTVFRWLSRENTGFSTASGSYSYHGPGRGPANSLNALVDGHRLSGEPRFLAKAEQLIRRVVHPREDVWKHRLDDPENKWFYLMFLQSLGKYVAYKASIGQLDEMYAYGRAALLHYARWMAEHEYPYLQKPERLTFPTETWATHEIRKSDVFYLAALNAEGDERARFVERGRFFFDNAVNTLATMPTRTLARPMIVMLSSGLMHPWFQTPAGAATALPPGPSVEFAPQAPFVPQKQIALKRAKILVAAGALAMLAAAAVAAYLLLD